MNKKDFKKQFINEFKQENTPTTSFNDVFKEQPKEENIYYKKYLSLNRKFKLSIAFSCIMLLVLIIGLSISIAYVKDQSSKTNVFYLDLEDKILFSETCSKVEEFPYSVIKVFDDQYLVIYNGYNRQSNNEYIYYYFYKVINYSYDFVVMFNSLDKKIEINSNNLIGLFSQNTLNESLSFNITVNNIQKDYII